MSPHNQALISLCVSRHRPTGFTLIEVMMVVAVIAILSALLSPMYTAMQRSVMQSRTQFVLKKVDTALRLFKTDWSVFPYQPSYPDLAGGDALTNDLFYRVGTDIDSEQGRLIRRDMKTAADAYGYHWSGGADMSRNDRSEAPTQASALTFRTATTWTHFRANALFGEYVYQSPFGAMALLNRMAQEQARLAVLAGNVDLRGPIICQDAATVAVDQTGVRVIPAGTAESRHKPGWAQDYLAGDIERRLIDGEMILDAWRRPLVYICQQIPGMRGSGASISGAALPFFDTRYFGLGALGFDPSTGPGPGLIAGGRPLLLYGGRVRLSHSDAGDRLPTPVDAAYFPDADNLMGSDVRYYAAPGYETEFELWSAGRDGRFSYRRDDPVNRDNVAVVPYHKGLQ